MKKFMLLISLLLLLAACGTSNGEEEDTNGSQGDNPSENASTNDLQHLFDQLDFNAEVISEEDEAKFNMSLENVGEEMLELSFSSGQQYEIVVNESETGEEVYRYSADKMFTLALIYEELNPGEKKTWEETWDYKKLDGTALEAGEYEVEIELVIMGINDYELESHPFKVSQTVSVPETVNDGNAKCELVEDSDHFRNVEVHGTRGSYTVTGEAAVFEGTFLYTVEDGHHIFIDEQVAQTDHGTGWGAFELNIEINEEQLPDYGVLMLILYFNDVKDGEAKGHHFVTLENFNE